MESFLGQLLKPSRQGMSQLRAGSPAALLALWAITVAVMYNFGYYASLAFPYIGKDPTTQGPSTVLGQAAVGPTSPCGVRLRKVQAGFFYTHACWFHTTQRPQWVITNLYFNHRAAQVGKGDPTWVAEEKCAFAHVGVFSHSKEVVSDTDRAVELLNRMQDSPLLDDCTAFIYANKGFPLQAVDERIAKLPKTLKRLYTRPLWTQKGESLDREFYKMSESARNANFFVKLGVQGFDSDVIEGFVDGLGSGRVSVLLWERAMAAKRHSRYLKDEVDFVAGFGYAVYLVSAEIKATKQDFTRVARPAAVLRLDGGYWDDVYNMGNANLVVTIVAVKSNHPFRAVLEKEGAVCHATRAGGAGRGAAAGCDCDVERFSEVPMQCSLGYLLAPWQMYGNSPPAPSPPGRPVVVPVKGKKRGL